MPRHRKNERVVGHYYVWLLSQRNGVWRADGRSNQPRLGRHSLGTRSLEEAKQLLVQLDLKMAVQHGRADATALGSVGDRELPLNEGRKLYESHAGRPQAIGGLRRSSLKRYRAVLDKFLAFAGQRGLTTWNQVNHRTLEGYVAHLEDSGYAYRTEYLEVNTVKQTVAWLAREGHLPEQKRITLPLAKPVGTDTYCWRPAEVVAMVAHCRKTPGLEWLGDVIRILSLTGLRISELINLRWSDIKLEGEKGCISLADESRSKRSSAAQSRRTLKGRRGRVLTIHTELRPVFEGMQRHNDGFVCHGPRGGRLKADTVRRVLVRDVLNPLSAQFPTAENDIGFKHGRLHSFRHFFCSLCAAEGVPQNVLMRWLGHRDSEMVDHYYHLHDEEGHRQMGRISLFDDLEKKTDTDKLC